MTFNPNIPQSTDIPSQSQAQFLTNFTQLNTVFGQDHVTFNDATSANRGKHDQSTYIDQGSDPATSSNEIALYSKALSGVSTLYMRKESSGTVVQLSGVDPSAASSGTTFLPGGLVLKWGTSASVSNNGTVNFATPFANNCFAVCVTINIGSTVSPVGINGSTTSGFTFRTTAAGGVPIQYIAIGN